MNRVDYNEISRVYDDVRRADIELINAFLQEVDIHASMNILDLGCGTGNNTDLLRNITQANVCGIDPSEGMLSKARQKNQTIIFKRGEAERIPFEDEYFDFVYMTDVIHHVRDIRQMFSEICRVLKKNGKVCIVTQSHRQIENRPIVQFFPSTAIVDKERYPDIPGILAAAAEESLKWIKSTVLSENEEFEIDASYLELVRKKGYSMLHLISDEEYNHGLMNLEKRLKDGNIKSKLSGTTLVWLIKESS